MLTHMKKPNFVHSTLHEGSTSWENYNNGIRRIMDSICDTIHKNKITFLLNRPSNQIGPLCITTNTMSLHVSASLWNERFGRLKAPEWTEQTANVTSVDDLFVFRIITVRYHKFVCLKWQKQQYLFSILFQFGLNVPSTWRKAPTKRNRRM